MTPFYPLLAILVVWWLVTVVRVRAARRRATGLSRSTDKLLLDALDRMPPATLYARIAATATDSLGASYVVVFAAEIRDGQESWSIPYLSSAAETGAIPAPAGLLIIAGEHAVLEPHLVTADDRPEVADVQRLFRAHQLEVIVSLYRDASRALLVGLRLGRMTATTRRVLEHWRVCCAAVTQAQAIHGLDAASLELASEADMARFLAATALSERLDPREDLDWAVRFYSSDAAPYFLTTYRPTESTTLVVFGRPIATGVAASLMNVSIKSCCDVMVQHLGSSVTWQALGQRLNHFLWQPRNPVGVHCHILLLDRDAEIIELASAGKSTLLRVPAGEVDPDEPTRVSCGGQPLGTSIEGTWRVATLSLRPGDAFVACTETGDADIESAELHLPARLWLDAESLIDAAAGAGIEASCLLAVVVR